MNLPNKLTVLRVILVPFFVVFLLLSKANDSMKWIALALFIIASLTDLLDGQIARKYSWSQRSENLWILWRTRC